MLVEHPGRTPALILRPGISSGAARSAIKAVAPFVPDTEVDTIIETHLPGAPDFDASVFLAESATPVAPTATAHLPVMVGAVALTISLLAGGLLFAGISAAAQGEHPQKFVTPTHAAEAKPGARGGVLMPARAHSPKAVLALKARNAELRKDLVAHNLRAPWHPHPNGIRVATVRPVRDTPTEQPIVATDAAGEDSPGVASQGSGGNSAPDKGSGGKGDGGNGGGQGGPPPHAQNPAPEDHPGQAGEEHGQAGEHGQGAEHGQAGDEHGQGPKDPKGPKGPKGPK